MTAVRQDAWSADDDIILAEVTLRHIREGGTQLGAFEEVGERIGRTSAACGFRWNSCVRKRYEDAIQIAKQQRQKRNYLKKQSLVASPHVSSLSIVDEDSKAIKHHETLSEESITIEGIIRFLRQWRGAYQELQRQVKLLEKDLLDREEELADLRDENQRLSSEVSNVQTDYRTVNDDYKTLIQIMDRARRLTVLSEEEEQKQRFKMDANGNLERIE
ncbi:transcription factor, RsfA family [Paenibacillus curdlanolyticus YK9]|uniref:Transcription factor, RsfA family n=1 Tax=Paenibacillus curdlanolyticus YK9 TaxID=717606 RepID=E0I3E1_9BACL|nr:RsfA family transcriptional regulator [Paenibacillus curdlanolyticus]EFM12805.1 transcription factor, RsfA family [Paenibacillus curdlanolyticus YK9]